MPIQPPEGASALPVTNEAIDVRVAADLDTFYTRLLNSTRKLLSDLSQRRLTNEELGNALEIGLNKLGDTLINQMGRTASAEVFNLGRNITAQELKDQIGVAVRTEVLDANTCDNCLPIEEGGLDGTVVELNSDEYFDKMPPNYCDGGESCRGFYLYRLAA